MKIVVTNDDGYDQPGLAALVDSVTSLGDVVVVAPATPQSNVAHRVTMKTPIQVDRSNNHTHVVYGTPADCSRLAIKAIAPDVDWVIAGINPGANLGSDVYQSGTVAAVREAAILGKAAVAVSQYIAPDWTIDWPAAQALASRLLPSLVNRKLDSGQFWNVNLPSPIDADSNPGYRICPLDKHPHKYRYGQQNGAYVYQGIIHDRPRAMGSDVDVCFGGTISVTRMEI